MGTSYYSPAGHPPPLAAASTAHTSQPVEANTRARTCAHPMRHAACNRLHRTATSNQRDGHHGQPQHHAPSHCVAHTAARAHTRAAPRTRLADSRLHVKPLDECGLKHSTHAAPQHHGCARRPVRSVERGAGCGRVRAVCVVHDVDGGERGPPPSRMRCDVRPRCVSQGAPAGDFESWVLARVPAVVEYAQQLLKSPFKCLLKSTF